MFNIGDYVKIKDTSIKGYIYRIAKKGNYIQYNIKVNTATIKVEQNNLELLPMPKKNITGKVNFVLNNTNEFTTEIMLRHQTVDEALFNLDKFIDSAICKKEKRIRIIHGKNGGILRNAVHKYLKSDNRVQKFELAQIYEGSYGVTIAYLK